MAAGPPFSNLLPILCPWAYGSGLVSRAVQGLTLECIPLVGSRHPLDPGAVWRGPSNLSDVDLLGCFPGMAEASVH